MNNIVAFPKYTMRDCSGNETAGMSTDELRETAWANYYSAERDSGATPDLAYQRAEQHILHFDRLIGSIEQIMKVG